MRQWEAPHGFRGGCLLLSIMKSCSESRFTCGCRFNFGYHSDVSIAIAQHARHHGVGWEAEEELSPLDYLMSSESFTDSRVSVFHAGRFRCPWADK
jgi:hypothetical protein